MRKTGRSKVEETDRELQEDGPDEREEGWTTSPWSSPGVWN